MASEGLLVNLNPSQHAAVTCTANTLAILAGPGSGKTHTLTSRTAWLLAQGLQPWNIIVATFTVKAAREMKERIGKLIGNGMEGKLVLGTFHSIARRYLARYGHLIGIKNDFGIADTADSAAILKRIIKRRGFMIDPKVARSRISGCKARGAGYKDEAKKPQKSVDAQEFEEVYADYEKALERSNLLDYDDLLLRCVELLRLHPACVSNVESVLIDEFQDTNVVQFDLMRLFAANKKCITIVGDPDQSIYGFRAAEVKNYKRLLHQYPDTITIPLEENYRSTGAILMSALTVIQQDTARVDKSLLATHCLGTRPVLRKLFGAHKEAEWIVMEIQRCLGMTGGLLDLGDFAILVRSASLSRLIESALAKSGIAYRMVGGLRFYDRLEVKLVLDYLRIVNQPSNNDALARIVNVPSRRIGEATIKALLEEADTSGVTLWQLILDVVQSRRRIKTQVKKAQEQGLRDLVHIILGGQKKISAPKQEADDILSLVTFLLEKLDMENWLKKQHNDETGARWDNIQELITQVNDFQDLLSLGYEDQALPEIADLEQTEEEDHLARFLANVALASEVKNADETAKPQVTISTIHAAKGLEWPVVFIPAVYDGSMPHSRAEDADEERRLLYVAMTRAKAFLYLSCPMKTSSGDATTPSPFLTSSVKKILDQRGPSIESSIVRSISQILKRECPSLDSIVHSSAMLQSTEDDLIPVDGENVEDMDLKWSLTQGIHSYDLEERESKRRKVESRCTTNDVVMSRSFMTQTTMTKVPTSLASSRITSEFVSAGYMRVLHEHSVNSNDNARKSRKQARPTKAAVMNGQSTLSCFLESATTKEKHLLKPLPPATTHADLFNNPRCSVDQTHKSIDIALASHRISSAPGRKPIPHTFSHHGEHDKYVFLSSSPAAPTNAEPPPTIGSNEAAQSTKSLVGACSNPTYHVTSLDLVKDKDKGSRKVLGIRRSVGVGWGNHAGAKFKPPTMQTPRASSMGERRAKIT